MYILIFVFCYVMFCLEKNMFFRTLAGLGILIALIGMGSPFVFVGYAIFLPTFCYKIRNVKFKTHIL